MIPATTGLSLDGVRGLLARMPPADEAAADEVHARDMLLTKPAGSLGRLEEVVAWLAAWQGRAPPTVDRPLVAVFAGNHGVAARGVSAFPVDVTRQMVANFASGGAAINQLCRTFDLGLTVRELDLAAPTGDITREAALDAASCAAAIDVGMGTVTGDVDLLCVGEMGIGNTTVAAALCVALLGGEPSDWVGAGTGVDEAGLERKRVAVAAAIAHHKEHLADPLEVLRRLGGRELAAIAGAILVARLKRVPVIVDGFVASAAAAVLFALDAGALDHCLFAHVSAERGHRLALDRMGKRPLLDLGMRLGEGSGAAIAAGIVRAAVRLHTGMATFAEASVSGRGD